MQRLLIVGSGDIARRAIPWLKKRFRTFALLRRPAQSESWRRLGVTPVPGDLDQPDSLKRLAGLADQVLHLAPPGPNGTEDHRTRHLLAALSQGGSLPRRLVYVSTTGVYGNCNGAWIDETQPRYPCSDRGRRRLSAEKQLRQWGAKNGLPILILRAPGIYAADRLPLERIKSGLPALRSEQDVYSNHIHAEDLAYACCLALFRGGAGRSFNVVDDHPMKIGDYFDQVADHYGLKRPPRVSTPELAHQLSPAQLSFMVESRRITNLRIKQELGMRLHYPHVKEGLLTACNP